MQDFSKAVRIIKLNHIFLHMYIAFLLCSILGVLDIFKGLMYFGSKFRMRSFWEVHVLPDSVTPCARDSDIESCCRCCLVSATETPTGGLALAVGCTSPRELQQATTIAHRGSWPAQHFVLHLCGILLFPPLLSSLLPPTLPSPSPPSQLPGSVHPSPEPIWPCCWTSHHP